MSPFELIVPFLPHPAILMVAAPFIASALVIAKIMTDSQLSQEDRRRQKEQLRTTCALFDMHYGGPIRRLKDIPKDEAIDALKKFNRHWRVDCNDSNFIINITEHGKSLFAVRLWKSHLFKDDPIKCYYVKGEDWDDLMKRIDQLFLNFDNKKLTDARIIKSAAWTGRG